MNIMQTILIQPKDAEELNFIKALFERMEIKTIVLNLTDEEKEDFGLGLMMQEVDRNDTVPVEDVLRKLKS